MAETKNRRTAKKQLGAFFTPLHISSAIVDSHTYTANDKILEPSMGDGSFIMPLIDKFMPFYDGDTLNKLTNVLNNNVFGVELTKSFYDECLKNIENKYGCLPQTHNLINQNFLEYDTNILFTKILGNPPFGGTIPSHLDSIIEKQYGKRYDLKIKKETYSIFIVKCMEMLEKDGLLNFICSDTFKTIATMKGLRNFLLESGQNSINDLSAFSEETNYPMVTLTVNKSDNNRILKVNGNDVSYNDIVKTDNFSWSITEEIKYFNDKKISDFMVCSSGMTVGKNEYFIREIIDGCITETKKFTFFDDPITLEKELQKAKNNTLGDKKRIEVYNSEMLGITTRNVRIEDCKPYNVSIPNENYAYYNKASNNPFYVKPKWVIYWKDGGDAVYTFKKNGNWYLHGVGGKPFFEKEGLSWSLISSKINARYLPSGYILDSGAPVGVLKDGIDKDELYFIIGWLNTRLATRILKNVINHTKNIQSKDIERMPYPSWVNDADKKKVVSLVKKWINQCVENDTTYEKNDDDMEKLEELFVKKVR